MFRLLNPRFLLEHPRIAKLVLVIFVVVFSYAFYHSRMERRLCQTACNAQEYAGFRYIVRDKSHPPRCFCLTQEETEQKDIIPKGTAIDFLPEHKKR